MLGQLGPILSGVVRTSMRASHVTRRLSNSTQASQVSLEISPRVCLYDVPSRITVKGLQPKAPVTLKASLISTKQREFVSNAHYIADDKGEVNVSRDVSVGGSYKGVLPMGLLTTLKPAPGVFKYARVLKNDVAPETVQVSLYQGHVPVEAHFMKNESSRPEAITTCHMERHVMGPGVRRIPVRKGRLRGTLFLPSGPGPFPGVLDTFGRAGGLVEIRAALLASRGIAALSLALFDFEDLPTHLERVELEYFEEAVDYLLDQPGVIPDRCGFVSVCLSSYLALACGAWMDRVKAVTTIGGFTFFYESHLTYKNREYFGEFFDGSQVIFKEGEVEASISKNVMGGRLDPEHPLTVPVEEADDDTYFLALGGDRDVWHLHRGLEVLEGRLTSRGRSDKIRTILYPGVGHLLEVPYTPLCGFIWQKFSPTMMKNIGRKGGAVNNGSDQPHLYSLAQVQHWSEIQNFIMHHVRDKSLWYQNHIHR
ncbi:peroxisomal succinyl-coenzyme A thioesterase-like isoform X3 [Oratosquilla oratoria]